MTELVTAARKYLGIPFRHRGRSEKYVDCIGLLVRSFADIGRQIQHDKQHYGREPHADGLREGLIMEFGEPAKGIQVGDVALIAYNTVIPHHVAIVGDYLYGGLSLIHADGMEGRVVEHRLDARWQKMIIDTFRDS